VEPVTLATSALSLLTPYLMQAGEVIATKAGEAAWERAQALHAALKRRLGGDAYAEQTLQRLEQDPRSASRQAALVGVLEEKIAENPTFARFLLELVAEAGEERPEPLSQQVTVSGNGRVGAVTQIGVVKGNVDL
jgi:hypothetical protein